MKNRLTGRRVALVAAVLCGCAGLSPSSQAQVKLELKYPPGRALKPRTTSKTHQVLTIAGMPIETESNRTAVTSETVGKVRDDSTIPVTIKFESLKIDLSLPGGLNVNFDSAEPDAKIEPPQLAFLGGIFRLLSRVSFTLVIDKNNAFKAVEGTEAIREEAEKLGDQAKLSVMGPLSAERLKTNFMQAQARIPDILVRPGESWERTEVLELEAGQTLTFRKKYEYLGTEKKGAKTFDKIGVKATEVTYAQDPAIPSPIVVTKSDLKVDSVAGTILFDREGGYTALDKQKDRIAGDMTFMINGKELPGKLDLTIETETETPPAVK